MSSPYIGEIRIFAGNFAPEGWAYCDGQSLEISQNDTLFALIGTTYGGDGEYDFNLPDLQGRFPMHTGNGYVLGQKGGYEEVTLSLNQIPIHTHYLTHATQRANTANPSGAILARSATGDMQFNALAATTPMRTAVIQSTGGSQPHDNMPPYLCVGFILSLYGIFPQQN